MQYSIEIGKIIEGALKYDQKKVINYTRQLIEKLKLDKETKIAERFKQILDTYETNILSTTGFSENHAIPVDIESRTMLADIVYPSQNKSSVILSHLNSEKLNAFILNYQNIDKLISRGLCGMNTLLLYGPPGCGKTKCAYFIAQQLNLPLIIARLDSIVSSYLGTTSKNIRLIFEYVQKQPCVLFLDEFDAIAKARDDSNELGELKRVVNSLLQNVDSLGQESLLVAATNHEQLLDSAVWRRFSYKLKIDFPDEDAIRKMILLFLDNSIELNKQSQKELSSIFKDMSGADIEEVLKNALRKSVIKGTKFSLSDIYDEFFYFKDIIPQNITNSRDIVRIKAQYLRHCNEKIFSLQNIADILERSKTTIQKYVTQTSHMKNISKSLYSNKQA